MDTTGKRPHRPLDPVWVTPLLFLIIGSIFTIPPLISSFRHPAKAERNKDYSLWYEVGRNVIESKGLYEIGPNDEVRYMYPPTMAVLIYAPLTFLGWPAFCFVLGMMNTAAYIGCVYLMTLLVAGRWDSLPRTLYWLPGFIVGPYIWDLFLLGQINLVLLAMVLASFLALRKGQEWRAGMILGATVAMKVFPLPVIAYFVVRRSGKAVLATLIAIVLFGVVCPGIVRGFGTNNAELKQWFGLMIGDQSGATMAARSASGFTRRNQSLVSLSHRLLRPVDAGERDNVKFQVNLADLSPGTAQKIGYGAVVVLGVVLLVSCRFQFGKSIEQEGLEIGMVCTLVPLCSPLAWTYFFCWLLPGWTAMLHFLLCPRGSRAVQLVAWCGAILSGLLLASALSEQIDPILQAYGVTAWGAVVLFLTLAYARFMSKLPVIGTAGGDCPEQEPHLEKEMKQ